MRVIGFGRPIVWTFLPTPTVRDLIRELDPEVTIYYCIDDLSASSMSARRVRGSETRLLREADLVFVTSEKLRERAARVSRRVHLFPFAVNYGQFEAVRRAGGEPPDDLRELPRPVIGYLGGVHQWVDTELLAEVAGRLPETSFALVGPLQVDVSRLARAPNVHLLGARAHTDIPRYVKGFDVGLVPYRLSEYTANVYPTKLNEYLAMGIPVVATDLPEIRRFNAEHGSVVAVASTAEEFVDAIRTAVRENSPVEVERRIEIARHNSWEPRIARMSDLIEAALARRRAAAERWQDVLRRAYRKARRRVAKIAVLLIGAYVLVFETPFIWLVAEPLRVGASPEPADAIVVFAGGVGESGKAGGGYQERVKQAVDLYRAGYASHMIFSSGYSFAFREAEVMRDLALAHGVPAEAIVLETHAANTYENVVFARRILDRQGWERILLVSSPYHIRRALLTWHRTAPAVSVVPTPVPQSQFYSHGRGATLDQIQGILHEYLAIALYWWRGWL
jgi:uncharacterized SAM-binding protein YcdF (DUF218 family)